MTNYKFPTWVLAIYFLGLSLVVFFNNGILWNGVASYILGTITTLIHIKLKKPAPYNVNKWIEKLNKEDDK